MTPHIPDAMIAEYSRWKDLPDTGPALLRYSAFAPLFLTEYWLPVSNRKILCRRLTDQTGTERLLHSHAPYKDLVKRWLEEALADANSVWATPEEINRTWPVERYDCDEQRKQWPD